MLNNKSEFSRAIAKRQETQRNKDFKKYQEEHKSVFEKRLEEQAEKIRKVFAGN